MVQIFDVVIAGGAVMGSSIAYHLLSDPGFRGRVLVVEKDRTYARAASALSASSIRQQFSQPVNIRISLHGIQFLRDIGQRLAVEGDEPAISLREAGYLYVADTPGLAVLRENQEIQRAEGADIDLLDAPALANRFPWLNMDTLAGGTHGASGEGWFDGYGLMQAFARKARSLGAEFRQDEVVSVEMSGDRAQAVQLASGEPIACGMLVNTCGASGARKLAALCGVDIPVFAKKRCVFSFTAKERPERFPLLIDTSGVWCRPEGEGYIAGISPDDLDSSDHGTDFDVDWSQFETTVWPALAERVPAFEAIRPGRAWAGHYDMNLFDHNAIVGLLGGLKNVHVAAGFSGHGIQQSPAIGRGLAELIVHGSYRALDLTPLGHERIAAGRPLIECNVI